MSSMVSGLMFHAPNDEHDLYRCVACGHLRPHEGGEPQPYGEQVCKECGDTKIVCPGCHEELPRREFVAPSGLDDRCGGCAYVRDMANGAIQ